MFSLFGDATDRLCKKLDAAASDGEDVEMESLFSRLTLDIIGKAVFNYDFDSLSVDTGIVEVLAWHVLSLSFRTILCETSSHTRSLLQAVYTVLREAEDRSVAPIPFWDIPIWKDISPKLRKVNAALKLVNDTLDDLIAICKVKFVCLFPILVSFAMFLVFCNKSLPFLTYSPLPFSENCR